MALIIPVFVLDGVGKVCPCFVLVKTFASLYAFLSLFLNIPNVLFLVKLK